MTAITPGPTIELTCDELRAAQDLASLGIEVRVHFTNWPGTPSVPALILPHGDPDGNVALLIPGYGGTRKLTAMPDELTVTARDALEIRPPRGTVRCKPCNSTGKIVRLYEDSDPEPWRPGSYADGVVSQCGDCNGTGTRQPI